MFWHFSVELSVFWGYRWDIYARNFMLPLDESKSSDRFNFIILQFKIILRKSPVIFPLYCRVENSEKIYMYLYKVLYVSFLCMDSGPQQNIKFFPGYSKLHNLNVFLNFFFLLHLCMCVICWLITDYFIWRYLSAFESPLDCKEIQPVRSKGAQSWVFIGRTGAEAETPILWPPQAKSWFIGKDSDAGRVWEQEEKGMTEDEMAGWHLRLDGHEFE